MLIKCPECGKEVSDKAPACIHCGFPLNDIHKENTCLVDGAEYDMTELKNYYAKLTDYEKGEFYRRIKSMYEGNLEIFPDEATKVLRNINEHFNWWNDSHNHGKGYLKDKFVLTCIDHNFQYFEFNTVDIPDPSKTVRCPKCGSTSVTTQERGYSIMWGVLGSTKKKNLCQKCGYTWWPGAGK